MELLNKLNLYKFTLLFVSLFIVGSLGQECLEPCEIPAYTCTYVNYPIYPVGLDVRANEAAVASVKSQMAPYANIISAECFNTINQYVCAYYYPSCSNTSTFNATTSEYNYTSTKIKPCLSQCTSLLSTGPCAPYSGFRDSFPDNLKALIDCDRLDADGTSHFYNDSTNTGGNNNNTNQCYTLSSIVEIPRCTNETLFPNNTAVQGGGCQKFDPSLSPIAGHLCAPFVNTEIFAYINNSAYQTLADQRASNQTSFIWRMYRMLPPGCYKRAMSLICQTAFPTCDRVVDEISGNTYFVPHAPCQQTCEEALGSCSYLLGRMGEEYANIVDCKATDSDGYAMFPVGPSYSYPVTSSVNVTTTCSRTVFPANSYEAFVLPSFERCPLFMGKKKNPADDEMQCWVPCPDPTYSMDEWDRLVIVSLVVSSISFVLMLFMLITSLLDSKRRKFRLQMPIYFSGMLMSVSFFLTGSNPATEVWCDDPATYATGRTNAACGAQAFLFQMFGLACVFWWVVIGFHMFSSVCLNWSPDLKHKEKYYHAFAWGIPAILAIITAAVDGHGFAPPAPWCYIHDPGYTNYYGTDFHQIAAIPLDYWVFYIPIGLSLMATCTFLGLVFWKVFRVLRTARSLRKAGNDARVQFRIVFFLLVLLLLYVLIFEWRFSLEASDTDKIKSDDLDWAVCKLKIDLGFGDTGECDSDDFPARINYNYTAFETSLAASFGFFIFLSFGTDPAIYQFWKKLLSHRSWDSLKAFVKDGTEKESPTASTLPVGTSYKKDSSKESKESKESKDNSNLFTSDSNSRLNTTQSMIATDDVELEDQSHSSSLV